MRAFVQPVTLLLAVFLCASVSFGQKPSKPEANGTLDPITSKEDLYPADADAKKEIEKALQYAVTEKKRVLLVFGGNWCYDCHVLDRALHEGAAGRLMREAFLLVHVDIGEGDKNLDLVKRYKVPLEKGVPAVVILNGAGDMLFSSANGEFEAARRMMKKDLLAFLRRWRALPARAKTSSWVRKKGNGNYVDRFKDQGGSTGLAPTIISSCAS